MSIKTNFPKVLYYYRKALQLTQEKAAEGLDISVRWYQMVENGRCLPGSHLALKMVAFFGIDGKLLRNEEASRVSLQVVQEKISQ